MYGCSKSTSKSTLSLISLAISISSAIDGGEVMEMLGAGGLPNSRVTDVRLTVDIARRLRLNLRAESSDTILYHRYYSHYSYS